MSKLNQNSSCFTFLLFIIYLSIKFLTIDCKSQIIPDLNYYEIIDKIDIKHNRIVKRNVDNSGDNGNESVEHLVSFRAINKEFNLLLSHNKDIINSQFNAFTVDSIGRKNPIFVDLNEFYSGRVEGILGSDVRAHIGSDGLMTATIQAVDDSYEIEPVWRHLDSHKHNMDSMIIYKHSDVVKHSSTSSTNASKNFCDFIKIDDNVTNEDIDPNEQIRRKRQSFFSDISISDDINGETFRPVQTHCAVVLVADFMFFERMGNSDQKTTINYLIHIIDRVNNIFNNTEWTDDETKPGFKGMGFFIKEIQIHTEPTDILNHYNARSYKRSVRDLLESFSLNRENSQFCLAHLFTHRTFDGSVLGLAYVASPRSGSVGGICSANYQKNFSTLYLNTGLTTTMNSFGQRIITREAVLVTAHEFGHNWGSEHDPHTDECSPSAQRGGAYVMYTYSVSGYDENNRFFSPCSKRSIRAVLVSKSHRCFSKPDRAYCGNSKVEEGEECDEGLLVKGDEYRQGLCCDSRCRFISGADCSDKNSDCCASCRIRPIGQVCKAKDEFNCKQESMCDGDVATCPPPQPLPDQTQCLDRGQCRSGKCISYCEAIGQLTCMCEHDNDACYRCCRRNTPNATCSPVYPRDALPNGTPCRYGFCENQRCERAVQDFVERFWDIIEEININTFLNFLKDNIVGVVILLSLIIWVPLSCAIHYYDQRYRREVRRRTASIGSDGSRQRRPSRRTFSTRLTRPSVRDEGQTIAFRTGPQVYYPSTYGT